MEDALSDLVRDINKLRLELTETREAAWSLVLVSHLLVEAVKIFNFVTNQTLAAQWQAAGHSPARGALSQTDLHHQGGGGPEGEDLGAGHQHQEQSRLLWDEGGRGHRQQRVGCEGADKEPAAHLEGAQHHQVSSAAPARHQGSEAAGRHLPETRGQWREGV